MSHSTPASPFDRNAPRYWAPHCFAGEIEGGWHQRCSAHSADPAAAACAPISQPYATHTTRTTTSLRAMRCNPYVLYARVAYNHRRQHRPVVRRVGAPRLRTWDRRALLARFVLYAPYSNAARITSNRRARICTSGSTADVEKPPQRVVVYECSPHRSRWRIVAVDLDVRIQRHGPRMLLAAVPLRWMDAPCEILGPQKVRWRCTVANRPSTLSSFCIARLHVE